MFQNFAVIFDMDGVIVDNSSFHVRAWNLFLQSKGVIFNEDMKRKVFGSTNREHLEFFLKRKLSDLQVQEYENEKEQIYRNLYESEIKPVRGLVSFLTLLTENNIPVALATSAPKVNIDFVLEKTGTLKFFHRIFDASSVLKGKPDPEIYHKAIDSLGMGPGRTIIIEDSVNGIHAAQAAGAKVIAITTTHQADELPTVDLIISDFEKLTIPVLRKLL